MVSDKTQPPLFLPLPATHEPQFFLCRSNDFAVMSSSNRRCEFDQSDQSARKIRREFPNKAFISNRAFFTFKFILIIFNRGIYVASHFYACSSFTDLSTLKKYTLKKSNEVPSWYYFRQLFMDNSASKRTHCHPFARSCRERRRRRREDEEEEDNGWGGTKGTFPHDKIRPSYRRRSAILV